jgi:hypothetical protein
MTKERQKIFFSYSRADGSILALCLAQNLKQKGFDVWIDQEDIKAGAEWDMEIEKALESCDCVLFLETEKSVVSHNVLDEVYYALEQKKKVIPLIYVDSKTPFRLKRLQHIDFTKDYNTGLAQLVSELEGTERELSYVVEGESTQAAQQTPTRPKILLLAGVIAGIAVLITAVVILLTRHKTTSVEVIGAVSSADTITTSPQTSVATIDTLAADTAKEKEPAAIVSNRATVTRQASGMTQKPVPPSNPKTPPVSNEESNDNLISKVVGNWRLTGVEPAAQSQRGYLKIEASEGDKATIKTYIQFYYPEKEASSYLTVFNAFAGCGSCAVSREMKLITEDVAIGSRTIKKQTEDGPDGQKAGDVILDASSNKSVGGTVTLQFVDNDTAVIRIKQSRTITLAHELMLEPFEYTFRFKKSD